VWWRWEAEARNGMPGSTLESSLTTSGSISVPDIESFGLLFLRTAKALMVEPFEIEIEILNC
jgi:hypothetical protein